MISKVFSCVSPPEILPSEGGIEQWLIDISELCLKEIIFPAQLQAFFSKFLFLDKGYYCFNLYLGWFNSRPSVC